MASIHKVGVLHMLVISKPYRPTLLEPSSYLVSPEVWRDQLTRVNWVSIERSTLRPPSKRWVECSKESVT